MQNVPCSAQSWPPIALREGGAGLVEANMTAGVAQIVSMDCLRGRTRGRQCGEIPGGTRRRRVGHEVLGVPTKAAKRRQSFSLRWAMAKVGVETRWGRRMSGVPCATAGLVARGCSWSWRGSWGFAGVGRAAASGGAISSAAGAEGSAPSSVSSTSISFDLVLVRVVARHVMQMNAGSPEPGGPELGALGFDRGVERDGGEVAAPMCIDVDKPRQARTEPIVG
ncbi:hypothetical protein Esti_003096 [Eimeria stiedai]